MKASPNQSHNTLRYNTNPVLTPLSVFRPFPSYSKPLFQSEAKCEVMEIICYSPANKSYFHRKKDFALSLVLNVRLSGTHKWPTCFNQMSTNMYGSEPFFFPTDVHFIKSFEIGLYIYFFFRERSYECASCGRQVFSRVARICKVQRKPFDSVQSRFDTSLFDTNLSSEIGQKLHSLHLYFMRE